MEQGLYNEFFRPWCSRTMMARVLLSAWILGVCLAYQSNYRSPSRPPRWTRYRDNYREFFQNRPAKPLHVIPQTSFRYYVNAEPSRHSVNSRSVGSVLLSASSPAHHPYQSDQIDSPGRLHFKRDPWKQAVNWRTPRTAVSFSQKPAAKRCRSCGMPFLQDSFCKEDFVLKVYIHNVTREMLDTYRYTVFVYSVFKDTRAGRFMPLQTTSFMYHCDKYQASLKLQETYLLTGHYVEDTAYVDSCSWKQLTQRVTGFQWRFLSRRYSRFCDQCGIQRVLHYDPRLHQDKSKCYVSVDPRSGDAQCRDRFSLCRFQRRTNSCNFLDISRYELCRRFERG